MRMLSSDVVTKFRDRRDVGIIVQNNSRFRHIIRALSISGGAFLTLSLIGFLTKPSSTYKNNPKEKNPLQSHKVRFVEDENDLINADGKKGHLESIGYSSYTPSFYERVIKRVLDIVLSFIGLVVLSPILAFISIWVYIDDPGPVIFTQKRVGADKRYFKLHKFRSMKMSTPHDVPTHKLNNPDQYITKSGRFIRRHSLDELPQIWDIFIGNMSVIGPRPALWNQDYLIAMREKYSVNEVRPGLTGWAQINGRDELDILTKAEYDGEYVRALNKRGAILMDLKCFIGSFHVFRKDDSLIEGDSTHITP